MLNAHIDYDAHFPPEYEAGAHRGAAAAARRGPRPRRARPRAVGPLYAALGAQIFERTPRPEERADPGRRGTAARALLAGRLPTALADALDDRRWDAEIQAETDEALR